MKSKSTPFSASVGSLLSVAAVTVGHAAPLYWKTSTAAAWDSATWANSPGGTYDQPWVAGSAVTFEDNAGTALTIAGPASNTDFASITANENVTLTPANVLGTGGTVASVEVASGKTLNFAGQNLSTVVGTGFIKNGAGIWSLGNGNAYTGGFTLNAGTVAVSNVNALGAGSSLTLNGGTLRSTDGAARNLGGKYTTGIAIGGDVTLGDVINNGALTFSDATTLGAATRTLTVNSAVALNGIVSGNAGVGIIKTGPGILTLGAAANTYTGTTTISNGVLAIANTNAIPGFGTTGSYSVASGAALAVGNAVTDANITMMLGTTNFLPGSAIGFDTTAAARTYGTVLANTTQGNLGLVKVGNNTLTLPVANTYSGGTTISQGNDTIGITISNASALGSGPVLVNGAQQFAASLSVAANLSITNGLTLKRGNGGSNRATLGLGASTNWSGDITVDNTNANGFAAIMTGGTTAATASVISGNIGFSTLGTFASNAPTLALRTSNNFGKVTGSISLSSGYLQLLDTSRWEFSNASNTWGTLDLSNAGAIVTVGAANTLASGGVVTSTSATGGILNLNNQLGNAAYSQTIAGLGGNVRVGLLTGAATLTLNNTTDQTSSGVISGAISLVKSGPGKQTLTGINTYTGTTTINGGTLALGTTGVIPVNDLSISSGTLDLRKGTSVRSQFVNNLTLSGATLDIGLNATPDQIDALAATVSGTNTVKLHGSVPTGSYNLIATQAPLSGTFVLDTSDVTPSGFPTFYSAAVNGNNYVLTVTGADTPFIAYWRGDVSSVWKDSSAAPNSNWASSISGNSDAGQLPGAITDVFFSANNATNTNTTLGGDVVINSLNFESGTATVGGPNTLTLVAEFGNGLDVLPGANAILNTGNIVCAAASAVQEGGTLTVNGGGLGAGPLVVDGTLNLNMNLTKESLGGTPTGTISRGIEGAGVLTVSGTSNSFYEGAINNGAGTMALTKGGASTLTLLGTSNYSGGTTIAGGILRVDSSTALGIGTVAINGGQRLSLGDGVTVSNPITIAANTSPQGAGMLEASSGVVGTATLDGLINITAAPQGGGHFINAGSGTFDVKSIITSTVAVIHRNGAVNYWGGGTGYTAMSATGTVRLGADNGLATTSTVTLGVSGAASLDLAGHSQSLVGIVKGPNASTVGNSSTTADSVLSTTGTATFDGVITDIVGAGTRKTGLAVTAGALTLGGLNTYTGNTTVDTGASLILADNARIKFGIADSSGVNNSLTGPGTITLNGDFDIDTTLVDASGLTSGTWTLESSPSLPGAYGDSFQVSSGATVWTPAGNQWTKSVGAKTYTFDETTGVLMLGGTVGGGFNAWVASKGLTGPDATFEADPDKDGLKNGLEFALGGEPNPATPGSNSTGLLPIVSRSAGDLIFSFKRKDISESGTSLTFLWSTNLSFPSPANDVPVGSADSTTDTIVVDVTEDAPDADTDSITITIPAAKAAAGKVFGRLSAVQTP